MVYYGVVSKGCQRCRQRKIKCDQQKPSCMKCEKSNKQCPGFRNLNDVLFRNETHRIIDISRRERQRLTKPNQEFDKNSPLSDKAFASHASTTTNAISVEVDRPLSPPLNDSGINFFFAKYSFDEPPYSGQFWNWLYQRCTEDSPINLLRSTIEAVGTAGISNISNSVDLALKSKERYCEALAALKEALLSPVTARKDETLMAVILLGFFEALNFESWDRYKFWIAHIKGATALLRLRGPRQLKNERGSLLYLQIRSQILESCMEQGLTVPPILVRMTYDFSNSDTKQKWQERKIASESSITVISLQIVNFRAVVRTKELLDTSVIRQTAHDIDSDLEYWRDEAVRKWTYYTVDDSDPSCFDAKRQIYPTLWAAHMWNYWRTLRIIVNQIIVENETHSTVPNYAQKSIAISRILQLCREVCISVPSFNGTTHIISLIRPLHTVCRERRTHPRLRSFAIEQLRRIAAEMGIRQARLLADTVYEEGI